MGERGSLASSKVILVETNQSVSGTEFSSQYLANHT